MPVVLVGSTDDPHLTAVRDRLAEPAIVIDAESIQRVDYAITETVLSLTSRVRPDPLNGRWRGWVRRLAPVDWEVGVRIGSHDAVVKASWLTLLAAILRHPNGLWLTPIDQVNAAENKLVQYRTAASLGIRVPATIVTNGATVIDRSDRRYVAKPLGPSHYQDRDGRWLSVFTEPFDPTSPADAALLGGPPFLVQERIVACQHLRVVTVEDQGWVCALDATGLPIDWREEPRAHSEWVPHNDPQVVADATRLARAMAVGYSSQDWIVEPDGTVVFVDLNPAGQWLFLPATVADDVTAAIVAFLERDDDDV